MVGSEQSRDRALRARSHAAMMAPIQTSTCLSSCRSSVADMTSRSACSTSFATFQSRSTSALSTRRISLRKRAFPASGAPHCAKGGSLPPLIAQTSLADGCAGLTRALFSLSTQRLTAMWLPVARASRQINGKSSYELSTSYGYRIQSKLCKLLRVGGGNAVIPGTSERPPGHTPGIPGHRVRQPIKSAYPSVEKRERS